MNQFLKILTKTLICIVTSVIFLLSIWILMTFLLQLLYPTSLPFDQRFILVACLSSIGGMISFFAIEVYLVTFKPKEDLIHKRFMTNTKDD